MRDSDIDDFLNRAAGAPGPVDPALLERITKSLGESLTPVAPLPSTTALMAAVVLAGVLVATGSAALLGMHGIQAMNAARIAVIFPMLLALLCLTSFAYVAEMIPGSRRLLRPWALALLDCLAFGGAIALLSTDYGAQHFVAQGIVCLRAGLLIAVPSAIASWWLLRRGFAVDSRAAGVTLGTVAGLAGLGMLELHCPNFEAPHILVWHTGVVALGGILGLLIAARLFSRR